MWVSMCVRMRVPDCYAHHGEDARPCQGGWCESMHGGLIRKIKRVDSESEEFMWTTLRGQSLAPLSPSRTKHSSESSSSLQYRMHWLYWPQRASVVCKSLTHQPLTAKKSPLNHSGLWASVLAVDWSVVGFAPVSKLSGPERHRWATTQVRTGTGEQGC